MTLRRAMYC